MENKKILVVVDMQNDFCSEGGSLSNPETISVVSNVVKKINEYNEQGNLIYITLDTHDIHYFKTQEGQRLPISHCLKGTWGWNINDKIHCALDGRAAGIFEKPKFGTTQLPYCIEIENILEENDNLEIEFVGVCTDICVISNVLLTKTICDDSTIIKVDSKCCAGTTPERHNAALEVMKSCQVEVF